MRFAPFLLALALFPAAAQQQVEDAKRTITAIEGVLKQRPDDPTLWFYLSRFQSQAGNKAASIAALEKVDALGEGFLPTREFFAGAWEEPAFQAVRSKLEARLPRLDFAPIAFEMEDREFLPEGIAYDPGTASFLVGSINKKKIVRVAPGGVVTDFSGPDAKLDAVLGVALDSPRRILYVVSTSALTEAGEKNRRNEIVAFDADKGRVIRRVEVPGALQLNDVAVARGGRVFASDSASGAIYEIPAVGAAVTLVGPDKLRGSNGLAVSADVKQLYVAHSTGIAVVDIATGTWKRVNTPPRETVAAIDGLYEFQGGLIGVQNVTTPGRVIYMGLSADGGTITDVKTLLSHHHRSLDEPTTGAVTSHGFYLLAATGVTHFNRQGQLDNRDTLPRPTVLRVLLPR